VSSSWASDSGMYLAMHACIKRVADGTGYAPLATALYSYSHLSASLLGSDLEARRRGDKGQFIKDDARKYPDRDAITGGFAGGELGLKAFVEVGDIPIASACGWVACGKQAERCDWSTWLHGVGRACWEHKNILARIPTPPLPGCPCRGREGPPASEPPADCGVGGPGGHRWWAAAERR
jgi:hypothetical protein